MKLSDIGSRIAKLRMETGVSARDMSLSLGKYDNYINKLENNKAYPSMSALYDICEYLRISPKDFFDDGNDYPTRINDVVSELKRLDRSALTNVEGIVKEMNRKYK